MQDTDQQSVLGVPSTDLAGKQGMHTTNSRHPAVGPATTANLGPTYCVLGLPRQHTVCSARRTLDTALDF
jgi:hypothetical protein